jgi:hypothetical protein
MGSKDPGNTAIFFEVFDTIFVLKGKDTDFIPFLIRGVTF